MVHDLPGLLHILDHIAPAFPFMVPGALVVDIAKDPLQSGLARGHTSATTATQSGGDWPTTVRRLLLYGYSRYPRLHRYALRLAAGYAASSRVRRSRNTPLFLRGPRQYSPSPVPAGSAPARECFSCVPGVMLSACVPCSLHAVPTWGGGGYRVHPQTPSPHALASFRDETASRPTARSGAGHHLWLPVWRVSIPRLCRGASGARLPLTPAMPCCGLERRGKGGTTPPGAPPTIGPRGHFAAGAQGAPEPGHQDGRPDGNRELAVWVDRMPRLPSAIGMHDTVHTGARATQKGRNLRGVSACRPPQ